MGVVIVTAFDVGQVQVGPSHFALVTIVWAKTSFVSCLPPSFVEAVLVTCGKQRHNRLHVEGLGVSFKVYPSLFAKEAPPTLMVQSNANLKC